MNARKEQKNITANYGRAVNRSVWSIGLVCILFGIIVQYMIPHSAVCSMLLYSIGTSLFASAVVTSLTFQYMIDSREINELLNTWRLYNIYETKSAMNVYDANQSLQNCQHSVDIIAEGMSSFISAQGDVLLRLIQRKVKIRIISCDSSEMLALRAKDESTSDIGNGETAIHNVLNLTRWIKNVQNDNPGSDIAIRFHSSYPAFTYLKLDDMVFVGANLWRKQSQQTFALSFVKGGKGADYFVRYFDDLWRGDFVHEDCRLLRKDEK